jgi:hypothetical protein
VNGSIGTREASTEVPLERPTFFRSDQRRISAHGRKQRGIDGRRGMEAMGWDPPAHLQIPGASPEHRQDVSARHRVLPSELELHDHVDASRSFVVEEATEQGRRDPERNVPHDAEPDRRQRHFERVTVVHEQVRSRPARADRSLHESRIELDRYHEAGDPDELASKASRPRADLDDGLVGPDPERMNELSRESGTYRMPTARLLGRART